MHIQPLVPASYTCVEQVACNACKGIQGWSAKKTFFILWVLRGPFFFQKGSPWERGFSLHSATTDTAHLRWSPHWQFLFGFPAMAKQNPPKNTTQETKKPKKQKIKMTRPNSPPPFPLLGCAIFLLGFSTNFWKNQEKQINTNKLTRPFLRFCQPPAGSVFAREDCPRPRIYLIQNGQGLELSMALCVFKNKSFLRMKFWSFAFELNYRSWSTNFLRFCQMNMSTCSGMQHERCIKPSASGSHALKP